MLSIGVGSFDEWVAAERHRLDAIATRVFSDLAKQFDAGGDGERAIQAMERLVAIDPADEERLRRLLILEARYRGPDAALARAKELVGRLRREVDAEPEAATRAIIDDIKRGLTVTRPSPHLENRRTTAEIETPIAAVPMSRSNAPFRGHGRYMTALWPDAGSDCSRLSAWSRAEPPCLGR